MDIRDSAADFLMTLWGQLRYDTQKKHVYRNDKTNSACDDQHG